MPMMFSAPEKENGGGADAPDNNNQSRPSGFTGDIQAGSEKTSSMMFRDIPDEEAEKMTTVGKALDYIVGHAK